MGAEREPYALLERVFREEAGRLTASLVRLQGDLDLAEELIAEAVVDALEHWPRDGVPERPAAWLLTTARRKGLDRLRREAVYRKKLELAAGLPRRPAGRQTTACGSSSCAATPRSAATRRWPLRSARWPV